MNFSPPDQTSSRSVADPPPSIQCRPGLLVHFKPVITKAEKYAEFMRIDQQELMRHKPHLLNAQKKTEILDEVAKQLQQVSIL